MKGCRCRLTVWMQRSTRKEIEVTKVHELKCEQTFYQPLIKGDKTFEFRRDDRGFKVGDKLWLREIKYMANGFDSYADVYTGEECVREVTYTLRCHELPAVPQGWVILGIKQVLL